ncbi:MAG: hypothetical protein R3F61_02570 [Myxococcota bacterium]
MERRAGAVPSERLIRDTARAIQEIARQGALQTAIAIGCLITERLYDGEVEASSRTNDRTSLRRLAIALGSPRRGGGGISATGLWRAVQLYEIEGRLAISEMRHVTASHVYQVLGLPNSLQRELLERASRNRWSVRRLSDRARPHREGGRRGRPPTSGHRRALTAAEQLLSLADPLDGFADRDDPDEVRSILRTFEDARDRLDGLVNAIRADWFTSDKSEEGR